MFTSYTILRCPTSGAYICFLRGCIMMGESIIYRCLVCTFIEQTLGCYGFWLTWLAYIILHQNRYTKIYGSVATVAPTATNLSAVLRGHYFG